MLYSYRYLPDPCGYDERSPRSWRFFHICCIYLNNCETWQETVHRDVRKGLQGWLLPSSRGSRIYIGRQVWINKPQIGTGKGRDALRKSDIYSRAYNQQNKKNPMITKKPRILNYPPPKSPITSLRQVKSGNKMNSKCGKRRKNIEVQQLKKMSEYRKTNKIRIKSAIATQSESSRHPDLQEHYTPPLINPNHTVYTRGSDPPPSL